MRKIMLAIFSVVFIVIFTSISFATDQTATPNIDKRLDLQQKRIEQGLKSGQLTEKEAARLQKINDRQRERLNKMKADGKLTKHERERMQNNLNHTDRDIYRQKHDNQRDLNHDGRKDKRYH